MKSGGKLSISSSSGFSDTDTSSTLSGDAKDALDPRNSARRGSQHILCARQVGPRRSIITHETLRDQKAGGSQSSSSALGDGLDSEDTDSSFGHVENSSDEHAPRHGG